MNIIVAFPVSEDDRINYSIDLCRSSLKRFSEVDIIEIPGTPRPFFNEMLETSSRGEGEWFGWVNGDCQLLIGPNRLIDNNYDVIGLRRLEIDSGDKCDGVDGYLIRKPFWLEILSKDSPKMYVGGSHIDWWVTRATQKYGRYREGCYLAHISHERTQTSVGTDELGNNNITQYTQWAVRNNISTH